MADNYLKGMFTGQGLLSSGPRVRSSLYPGEAAFFKANPHVAGMAADDNSVILNPYSKLSEQEKNSVVKNEWARIAMRNLSPQARPVFGLTPEQTAFLSSTSYKNAGAQDRRETIAARMFSGDPSAGKPNADQTAYVDFLRRLLRGINH